MTEQEHEDELRESQGGRVYPLGRALRSTFDADNHDSLDSAVTGLMIDLSKLPYGPEDGMRPAAAPPPCAIEAPGPSPAQPTMARGWRTWFGTLFARGRSTA